MDHIIAVPLDVRLAERIGKRGSENSLIHYNGVCSGENITVLVPSSLQDKAYAIAESLLVSDQIVISTNDVDKFLGEILLACSLLNKRIIITDDNSIDDLLSNVDIKNVEFTNRDEILTKVAGYKIETDQSKTRVDIDKAFPVKGIGTVLLGVVTKGTVSVHDKLFSGSGREVQVRSIQANDKDIERASIYTRVGLAVKGVTDEEIPKGEVLSKSVIPPVKRIKASISAIKVNAEDVSVGKSYTMVSNFSYTNVTVISSTGNNIELRLDRGIQFELGDEILLLRERMPRIFAHGVITETGGQAV